MSGNLQVITDPILNLHVTSSVTSFGSERRYPKDLTISALKVSDIMYTWTGFLNVHRISYGCCENTHYK